MKIEKNQQSEYDHPKSDFNIYLFVQSLPFNLFIWNLISVARWYSVKFVTRVLSRQNRALTLHKYLD